MLSVVLLSFAQVAAAEQTATPVQLPLVFEENRGQTDATVRFVARGPGYTLFLQDAAATMVLRGEVARAVRVHFDGAQPRGWMRGPATGSVSHHGELFTGRMVATGVPHLARVTAQAAWPGIDVVFHGAADRLEYDLVVAPGADPRRVRLRVEGADAQQLDAAGNLVLRVGRGRLVHAAPVAYQEAAGGGRQWVKARYSRRADGTWAVAVGAYDRTRPLVIDPVINWGTYLGGSMADAALAMALGPNGHLFVTGTTESTDFPVTVLDLTHGGAKDAYVAKLKADGTGLVWATFAGGTGDQLAYGIAVNSQDEAYIAGNTTANDTDGDAFVFKLVAAGTSFYTHTLKPPDGSCPATVPIAGPSACGGSVSDGFRAVAVDGNGNAYAVGWTDSTDIPVRGPGSVNQGGREYLMAKFNNQVALLWSRYAGGTGRQEAYGVGLDPALNVYATGVVEVTGNLQANVIRVNNDGQFCGGGACASGAVETLPFGGTGTDEPRAIAVKSGVAYVAGWTESSNFPNVTGADNTYGGGRDAFLCRLNLPAYPTPITLGQCTYYGDAARQEANAIVLDGNSVIYTGGLTYTGDAQGNGFLARYNTAATTLVDELRFGGTGQDVVYGVAANTTNVFAAGETRSTNFPTTTGAMRTTAPGSNDAFVIKATLSSGLKPTVSVAGCSVNEGQSGTVNCALAVTLSDALGENATVNWASTAGTAKSSTPNRDFTAGSGTLTFAPGVRSMTISVPISGDTMFEADETFTLTLSAPSANLALGTSSATGTIRNDDTQPTVSVAAASATEGTAVSFSVSLSAISGKVTTVTLATQQNGSATAGTDFTATTTTVTIPVETASASATVATLQDARDEPNETFGVSLSAPVNASIGTGSATGTITDDDAAPSVSVAGGSSPESTTPFNFTVTLSAASAFEVTVLADTAAGTASTADFTAFTGRSVTIPAGALTASVPVTVNNDALDEPDETMTVTLRSPSNASLGTPSSATLTIQDNDNAPTVSVAAVTVVEGGAAAFPVTLSAASGRTVTVSAVTSPGTAVAADFTALAPTTVTFNAGETSKTVSVVTTNDATPESSETFTLTLSAPSNATLGTASATATLIDNDGAPLLSVGAATVMEGAAGTANLVFTVTLAPAAGNTVTVTANTSAGTATPGTDYVEVSNRTLTFAPGVTTQSLTVTVNGDTLYEGNETLTATLTNAANATIAVASATGTIQDDDLLPTVSLANAQLTEGDSGSAAVDFTLTLSGASSQTVTVTFATSAAGPDTATAGTDYTAVSALTVSFPPATVSRTAAVQVTGDTLFEADETFTVVLSSPVNATLGTATAVGTILNADARPFISVTAINVPEAAGTATFDLRLSAASGLAAAVTVVTSDTGETATSGADYVPVLQTVIDFPAGTTSRPVAVTVLDDGLNEDNETFRLLLSNPVNADVAVANPRALLFDDDAEPTLAVVAAEGVEGTDTAGVVPFLVTLSAPSGRVVSVDCGTRDRGAAPRALAGADYVPTTGNVTLTFLPGDTVALLEVDLLADAVVEPDEVFELVCSSPVNASFATAAATLVVTGTIRDDEAPLYLGFAMTADEGAEDASGAVVIELTSPAAEDVTVNLTVAGTAVAGEDYALQGGGLPDGGMPDAGAAPALTIPAGSTSVTLHLAVVDDALDEDDETVELGVAGATGATVDPLAATFTWTVRDNDAPPTVALEAATGTVPEGAAAALRVVLSAPSGLAASVDVMTTGGTAVAGVDQSLGGSVVIPAGQTSAPVPLTALPDTLDEDDETVELALQNPSHAVLGTTVAGTLTIIDDDAEPTVGFESAVLARTEDVTQPVVNVVLEPASGRWVSVDYEAAEAPFPVDAGPGAAAQSGGVDFTLARGTLLFGPGEQVKTVPLEITNDTLHEENENLVVSLSGPLHATLAASHLVYSIQDNDVAPDAGPPDAGVDAGAADAGTPADGGVPADAGAVTDAGSTGGGGGDDDDGGGGCACDGADPGAPLAWLATAWCAARARQRKRSR